MILKVLFLHFDKVVERLCLWLLFYTKYHLSQLLSFLIIKMALLTLNCICSHHWVVTHISTTHTRHISNLSLSWLVENSCNHVSPHHALGLHISNRLLWKPWILCHLLLCLHGIEILLHLLLLLILQHIVLLLELLVLRILHIHSDSLWKLGSKVLTSRHSSLSCTCSSLTMLDLFCLRTVFLIEVVLIIYNKDSVVT